MRVEALAAAVRPRATWEAADLGVIMVRHWWRLILGPWLLLYLALILILLVPALYSVFWVPFGVWLAKPVLDRLVLFILSRAMFGTNPSPSQALRETLRLSGHWGILLEMTFLRFRPDRVIVLCIDMLEGSNSTERDNRKQVIQRHLRADALGVSLIFLLFEAIIATGLYLMLFLVFPEQENAELVFAVSMEVVLAIGYVLAVGFLEIFYVGVNFSLYLNLRTKLESWDLRIAFQQIRARWDKMRVRSVVTNSLVLLLTFGMAAGVGLKAQEEESGYDALQEMRDDLPKSWELRQDANKILADPPFNKRTEKSSTWVPRWEGTSKPRKASEFDGGILSKLAVWLMWGVALAVVLALLFFVVRGLLQTAPVSSEPTRLVQEKPSAAFQAILGEEPLPLDILKAARADYAQGNLRKAMSYLFRGALAKLAENGTIQLAEFATEGECIREVKRNLGGELSIYFSDLVLAWQMVAYGHRSVDQQSFDALCQGWQQHLGVRK